MAAAVAGETSSPTCPYQADFSRSLCTQARHQPQRSRRTADAARSGASQPPLRRPSRPTTTLFRLPLPLPATSKLTRPPGPPAPLSSTSCARPSPYIIPRPQRKYLLPCNHRQKAATIMTTAQRRNDWISLTPRASLRCLAGAASPESTPPLPAASPPRRLSPPRRRARSLCSSKRSLSSRPVPSIIASIPPPKPALLHPGTRAVLFSGCYLLRAR